MYFFVHKLFMAVTLGVILCHLDTIPSSSLRSLSNIWLVPVIIRLVFLFLSPFSAEDQSSEAPSQYLQENASHGGMCEAQVGWGETTGLGIRITCSAILSASCS